MDLKQAIQSAEEFAKLIWPIKDKIKVRDLILRGSVARAISDQTDETYLYGRPISPEKEVLDLDLVILHENPGFDTFQDLMRNKRYRTSVEAFNDIKRLVKEVDLVNLLKGTSIEELIKKSLFHTSYMNTNYFTNANYRKRWDNQNNPGFAQAALSEGLLWDPQTKDYSIRACNKYNPLIKSLQ